MIGMTRPSTVNAGLTLGSAIITISLAFLIMSGLIGGLKLTYSTTGESNVAASANVLTYCSNIAVNNGVINFGIVNPGQNTISVPNGIVVNSISNVAGNVYIAGQIWTNTVSTANGNFLPSNTLYNNVYASFLATAQPLPVYIPGIPDANAVNSKAFIPFFSGIVSSNILYFTVNVPAGQAAGLYAENIIMYNVCTGTTPSNSAGTTNVLAYVTVQRTCYIQISNNLISFPAAIPGGGTPTANAVYVSDPNGNTNANIMTDGSNWISSGGPTFYVSNTNWNPTSGGVNTGNDLQLDPGNLIDTTIIEPYPPTSSGNNIFYGITVPPAQTAGIYTQNIVIVNSC
jgi:hypothetical protein